MKLTASYSMLSQPIFTLILCGGTTKAVLYNCVTSHRLKCPLHLHQQQQRASTSSMTYSESQIAGYSVIYIPFSNWKLDQTLPTCSHLPPAEKVAIGIVISLTIHSLLYIIIIIMCMLLIGVLCIVVNAIKRSCQI